MAGEWNEKPFGISRKANQGPDGHDWLPQLEDVGDGSLAKVYAHMTTYIYDAVGNKLAVSQDGTVKNYYCGDFVYDASGEASIFLRA